MRLSDAFARHNPVWLALLGTLGVALGNLSGVNPKLGIELALGLAFSAAVLANVVAGICLFTVISFLEVINGGTSLSVTKVVGLLLFVSWVAASSTRNHVKARSFLTAQPLMAWAMIAFVSWSAISVVWAVNPGAAIASTERFLLQALLVPILFTAIRTRRDLGWVIAAFIVGAAISAAYGFPGTVSGRLQGSIGDPNLEASVLVAGLALAIGLMASLTRGSAGRAWVGIAAVTCVLGFFGTISRGGLVAAGITLLGAVVIGGRWRSRAVMGGVIAVVLAGFYFTAVASTQQVAHVNSANSTGRSDLWKVGVKMFEANPVTGVGSGNYLYAAVRYVQEAGSITRADLIVDVPHVAHNTYLEAIDDLGIPGLLFLVLILLGSLRAGVQAANRYARAGDLPFELLSRTVVLALLGTLAADVFIVGQYSKQLWLLLALPPVLLALSPATSERWP